LPPSLSSGSSSSTGVTLIGCGGRWGLGAGYAGATEREGA
jgi:hypothetical protein